MKHPPIPAEKKAQLIEAVGRCYDVRGALIPCVKRAEADRLLIVECYLDYYGYEGSNREYNIEKAMGCINRQNRFLQYIKTQL